MFNLAKLRERRENGEKGFTLIELLVVVVIIGILIAIAIPVYLNYKKGAADKSAMSDLRGAISQLEQCQTDNTAYPTSVGAQGGTPGGCPNGKISTSSGTTLQYYVSGANYDLLAYNSNGNSTAATSYCYASETGGSVKQRAAALTSYSSSC